MRENEWAGQSGGRRLAVQLLAKVEQDLAALRHLVPIDEIADEIIGFHAQQAAEKALKAVLAWHGIPYRRTHDLAELLDILEDHGVKVPAAVEEVDILTPFAVEMRYGMLSSDEPPLDRMQVLAMAEAAWRWAARLVGQNR